MGMDIKSRLALLTDEKYRKFTSSLLPGTKNISGIRLPYVRQLAKEIAKEEGTEYLKNAPIDTFEEIMLLGMVIGYMKAEYGQRMLHIKSFLPKIDNWSVCDSFCTGLSFVKKHRGEFLPFVKECAFSTEEFTVRFAAVILLNYYINDEYIDETLHILGEISHDGYYVKMAVAWAISVCMVKYPEKTLEFMKRTDIDKVTYHKAIQKSVESFRISNELKETLKSMKRK